MQDSKFAALIKSSLEKKGWTMSRLAEESGVTALTIRNTLTGKHNANALTLSALSKALEIDFDELYEAAKNNVE